jgi:hypothetical protein
MPKTTSAIKVRSLDQCCPSVLSAPLDATEAAVLARTPARMPLIPVLKLQARSVDVGRVKRLPDHKRAS